jgi:hypothetical protein
LLPEGRVLGEKHCDRDRGGIDLVLETLPYLLVQEKSAGLSAEHADRYRLVPYVSDGLADVLAAVDIVISRSDAGPLAELTAVGKPPSSSRSSRLPDRNSCRLSNPGSCPKLSASSSSQASSASSSGTSHT